MRAVQVLVPAKRQRYTLPAAEKSNWPKPFAAKILFLNGMPRCLVNVMFRDKHNGPSYAQWSLICKTSLRDWKL